MESSSFPKLKDFWHVVKIQIKIKVEINKQQHMNYAKDSIQAVYVSV